MVCWSNCHRFDVAGVFTAFSSFSCQHTRDSHAIVFGLQCFFVRFMWDPHRTYAIFATISTIPPMFLSIKNNFCKTDRFSIVASKLDRWDLVSLLLQPVWNKKYYTYFTIDFQPFQKLGLRVPWKWFCHSFSVQGFLLIVSLYWPTSHVVVSYLILIHLLLHETAQEVLFWPSSKTDVFLEAPIQK